MSWNDRFKSGGSRGPRGRTGASGGSGQRLVNDTVTADGQTVFDLAYAPTGDVLMFVNGVLYELGVDYTQTANTPAAGQTRITWLDTQFTLSGPVPGPADTVSFLFFV